MTRINTRRDYNVSTDPRTDLATRFVPHPTAIADAQGTDSDEPMFAAIALPYKTRGYWEVGQIVEADPTLFLHRSQAIMAAEAKLGDRPGVAAYAAIYSDGTWAVWEA